VVVTWGVPEDALNHVNVDVLLNLVCADGGCRPPTSPEDGQLADRRVISQAHWRDTGAQRRASSSAA
jgi:hypothetical protein